MAFGRFRYGARPYGGLNGGSTPPTTFEGSATLTLNGAAGLVVGLSATLTLDSSTPIVFVRRGAGVGYIYENIGVSAELNTKEGYGYIYENVGLLASRRRIGVLPIAGRHNDGVSYIYENVTV